MNLAITNIYDEVLSISAVFYFSRFFFVYRQARDCYKLAAVIHFVCVHEVPKITKVANSRAVMR
jgi:hypothetical protein